MKVSVHISKCLPLKAAGTLSSTGNGSRRRNKDSFWFQRPGRGRHGVSHAEYHPQQKQRMLESSLSSVFLSLTESMTCFSDTNSTRLVVVRTEAEKRGLSFRLWTYCVEIMNHTIITKSVLDAMTLILFSRLWPFALVLQVQWEQASCLDLFVSVRFSGFDLSEAA